MNTSYTPNLIQKMALYLGVLVLHILSIASIARAGDGPIGIRPYLNDNEMVYHAVKFRYKARVNVNSGNNSAIKILFIARSFYNPDRTEPPGFYQIETNLYSYWIQYEDTGCLGWPPYSPLPPFHSQSGLWSSIPDYPAADDNFPIALKGRVGVRPADVIMFPRQNSGIDNIPRLTKIETISQQNMTAKDIAFELSRGETFVGDLSNWGYRFDPSRSDNLPSSCLPDLPSGHTYRKWHLIAVFEGRSYAWDFALPEQQARYLDPSRMIDMVTEFFETAGSFQAFVWDFAVQDENRQDWQPIYKFIVTYQVFPDRNTGSGVKIGSYQGRNILEFSNDRTDTYAQLGDILILDTSSCKSPWFEYR